MAARTIDVAPVIQSWDWDYLDLMSLTGSGGVATGNAMVDVSRHDARFHHFVIAFNVESALPRQLNLSENIIIG